MDIVLERRSGEAGFSLVEIVISLGLFSLISLAGVVLVSSILQVRGRTEGRLDELGDLQRGLFVITSDLQQANGGSLSVTEAVVSFKRAARGGATAVKYAVVDGNVIRTVSSSGAAGVQQTLLDNVDAARWHILLDDGSWVDTWPLASSYSDAEAVNQAAPIALAVELDLGDARAGVSGTLRRVVELTATP